jgi:glyoxylase-like metal-dependent hydrolase (beta-lactamase superfamily II)
VSDPTTKKAVIIDSVLDFEIVGAGAKITTNSADQLLKYVKDHGLDVEMIMETHAHADHLTAAQYLKKQLGGKPKVAIGEKITLVQEVFAKKLNMNIKCDGSQFDKLIKEGEEWKLGNISCKSIATPGHTPACSTYVMGDSAFCG